MTGPAKIGKFLVLTPLRATSRMGILGPQMMATLLARRGVEAIVLGVERGAPAADVLRFVARWFGTARPVVGFSYLKIDRGLLDVAREVRGSGGISILGGPEAEVDFRGEVGKEAFPHRFQGYGEFFDLAVQGPGEQFLDVLEALDRPDELDRLPGVSFRRPDGRIVSTRPRPWDLDGLLDVDWGNLHFLASDGDAVPVSIRFAQVLQAIGCPYAAAWRSVSAEAPAWMGGERTRRVYRSKGCSFCAIAADKGSSRSLGLDRVLLQIARLPELEDGRKIAFELIDEAPIPGMVKLLDRLAGNGTRLSRISFLTRSDYLIRHERILRRAIRQAWELGIELVLDCVGFESYDQSVLDRLGKGTTVEQNLQAVRILRQLAKEHSNFFYFYLRKGSPRSAASNHGLIMPTPWDTTDSLARQLDLMEEHRLFQDVHERRLGALQILHSTPLGAWVRDLEETHGVRLERDHDKVRWKDRLPELFEFLRSRGFVEPGKDSPPAAATDRRCGARR